MATATAVAVPWTLIVLTQRQLATPASPLVPVPQLMIAQHLHLATTHIAQRSSMDGHAHLNYMTMASSATVVAVFLTQIARPPAAPSARHAMTLVRARNLPPAAAPFPLPTASATPKAGLVTRASKVTAFVTAVAACQTRIAAARALQTARGAATRALVPAVARISVRAITPCATDARLWGQQGSGAPHEDMLCWFARHLYVPGSYELRSTQLRRRGLGQRWQPDIRRDR